MNMLDMRTVFIGYSFSNAICAIVMAFLWWQNRDRSPELRYWLANFILQFLAVLLVTLRGSIPDFVSIVLANSIGVAGIILLYMGLERFVNRISSQRLNSLLLAIFFLVHSYFTYIQPNLAARNHNFSLAIFLICIQGAWLLMHRVEAGLRPRTTKVGIIFLVIALVSLARILLELRLPSGSDLFQTNEFDAFIILVFQMLYISLSFSLFLLVNHRLVDELKNDIVERKKAEVSLQQRLMELEFVNKLSISLRAGKNLEELLQILLRETLQAVNTPHGCILLFRPEGNTLEVAESNGWFASIPELFLRASEGVCGNVLKTNEPHISPSIAVDLSNASHRDQIFPAGYSGAFFSIGSYAGTVGMLIVSFPLPRMISENERRLLAIISQLAGNAIARSRLHDQVKVSNSILQQEIELKNRIQELLAAEKELLSTTLMSIADGVIVTDREGLVLLFNRAAEVITGYTLSEALARPVQAVFRLQHTATFELVPDVINYLLELECALKDRVGYRAPQISTKSGERILLSGSITLLKSAEDHTTGFVIVFQNINERQQAEAQNLLSQKMEAIGQLAAGIAHEINTPIQYVGDNVKFLGRAFAKYLEVVRIYGQMIQDHIEKPFTPEDVQELDEITSQKKITHYANEIPKAIQESLDGIERVRRIVLAMREFSHPSEKGKSLSNINHGIETTTVISRNEWKYCAELALDLDPELPLVNCQIDEINQVILNMIVNAAQAIQEKIQAESEQKGKISIRTDQQEGRVLITIQDTGSGIPPEIRERIFDPFFTTKGVGKGTGQGLSMAHNIIVKKHQGKISVNSEPGEGTTFTIELPVQSCEMEP